MRPGCRLVSLNRQETFRTDLAAQAKSGGCVLVFKTITSRKWKTAGVYTAVLALIVSGTKFWPGHQLVPIA